jgi:septum formation protein
VRLILASSSPRRRELLATLGVDFSIEPGADLAEAELLASLDGDLEERLTRLALLKGDAAAASAPDSLVLSADTAVVVGEDVLGKPAGHAEAVEMLRRLSGRVHLVITAVAVQQRESRLQHVAVETTRVAFHRLDDDTIRRYIQREQPYDKAGAYAIQGLGALLVRRIEGDYSNVVGLPLGATARLLQGAGLRIL